MDFKSMVMQHQMSDYIFAILLGGTRDQAMIRLDTIKPVVWFKDTLEVYAFDYLCFDNTWAFRLVQPE